MSSDFYAGLISGIVSNTICNPLDVIRVNKQVGNKQNIYNLQFLSRGLISGFITIPTFWSIYFDTYKKLKYYNSNKFSSIFNGYIASNIASTITSPLWMIRFKHQTTTNFNILEHYKQNGIKSFYNGLVSTYIVNASFIIQMPLYEKLKNNNMIKTIITNDTIRIFLITSIAKTFSACIFYPLDTVRAIGRNSNNLSIFNILNKLNKNPIMYYSGISIYLARSIPYYTSTFCTFEYIKKIKKKIKK